MSKRRRIIFDVSMAKSGGGFTYAVNVLPLLARRLLDVDIMIVLRSRRIAESLRASSNLEINLLPEAGLPERARFLTVGAAALSRKFGADLYYSASELSPFFVRCPKIAAFRNANLFIDPGMHWPVEQRLRLGLLNRLARHSARTCSRILFVSEDSARQIGEILGLPESRRAVVPHGIDSNLWSNASGPNPLERPFILSVSSIYRYKNFVRLIEAWTELARRWPEVPDLVIVGDDQDKPYSRSMGEARLRAGALAERIHIVGEVPYAEIARYYRHASAFVFPSYLETFGHPLLEAMAAGLPVVAADIEVFREIGGEAAIYFDPHDTAMLAGAMERAVRDEALRGALRARGNDRVAAYSWDRTIDGMVSLFNDVLDEDARDRC